MPPIQIPTLMSVDKDYAALVAKFNELCRLRNQVQAELYVPHAEPVASQREARVSALLADVVPGGVTLKPDHDEYAVTRRSNAQLLEDIDEAIRQLAQRMRGQQGVASAKICERISPQFARIMKDMLTAALAFHEAHRDYTMLMDDLIEKDVFVTLLNPVAPRFAESPTDRYSGMALFLREAVEAQWLKPNQVPQEFR